MTQTKLKLYKSLFLFLLIAVCAFLYQGKEQIGQSSCLYRISEVTDGDTIRVEYNGNIEAVRLLGINTPEVDNPYRKEECFGPEASNKTKQILNGKSVYLLPDPNAQDRDKYDRLLRYVYLEDGTLVNALLVEQGYAYAYIYKDEVLQFSKYFSLLEQKAEKNDLGLWGKCDVD